MIRLRGNDQLVVGYTFIINIQGTQNVLMVDGDKVRIEQFAGTPNQIWRCIRNKTHRVGFYNNDACRYLGVQDGSWQLRCVSDRQEQLAFRGSGQRGYRLWAEMEQT